MIGKPLPPWNVARALFGPLVWAAHFIVVYAAESVLCRFAAGQAHTLLLAVVTVLAILAVVLNRRGHSRGDGVGRFLARVAIALDALSVVAIMFVAAAGFVLPSCR